MSLGLRETRRRRKQKVRWTFIKWLIALAMIGAAGWYAYQAGSELAKRRVVKLLDDNQKLEATVQELLNERDQIKLDLEETHRIAEERKARYERDVPKGELKVITDSVREQLEAGVSVERLQFLIASAANEQACDGKPDSKRFYVNVPIYSGVNDNVSFANGGVTITARGESVLNAEGKVEAWFDPAKPITVKYTLLGGKTITQEGKLPLHKSVVVSGSEYRFSLTPGARGFVNVSGDRCDYP